MTSGHYLFYITVNDVCNGKKAMYRNYTKEYKLFKWTLFSIFYNFPFIFDWKSFVKTNDCSFYYT